MTKTGPQTVVPQNRGDLERAVDLLRGRQVVLVDLSHVPQELRERMLDYLSGGAFAADCRMESVARHVYMLSPRG